MNKLKKFVPLLASASALLVAAMLVVGAAAAPDKAFLGTWYSVDIDGSNQTLHIGGGPSGSYRVTYFDDGATVCGLDENDDFLYGASAKGWLEAMGATAITGELDVYCLASPPFRQVEGAGFEYYLGNDGTLIDQYGTIWTR